MLSKGSYSICLISENFRDHPERGPETRGETDRRGESGDFGLSRPLQLDEMGVKKETISPGDGMLFLQLLESRVYLTRARITCVETH